MRCVQVVPALYAVVTKMSSSRGTKSSQRVLSRWWLRYSRVRSGGSDLVGADHLTRQFLELSRTSLTGIVLVPANGGTLRRVSASLKSVGGDPSSGPKMSTNPHAEWKTLASLPS